MDYNYFEVLGLSIDEIQDKDEATIKDLVSNAYTEEYKKTVGAYTNVPRKDGLTQEQWRKVLMDAEKTLLNPRKRRKHIAALTQEPEELEQPVLTFPSGEEPRSIADSVPLMEKYPSNAADALYDGTLEANLRSADQNLFAGAAGAAADRFSDDRDTGLMAMIAVLHGEVRMQRGKGASTPQQLARLIDMNWDQAKTLLYNGFFAFWLEHINEQQLADTANEITKRDANQQDIGLETFVQRLDPKVGDPIPEISHPEIHFNTVETGRKKTIRSKIKNVGRGFLYGKVHLAADIPGLQVSDTDIYGKGVVTIDLDGGILPSDQVHQASLVLKTNGRDKEVPIYINHGIQPLIRWVVISGVSMAAIALFARLVGGPGSFPKWSVPLIFGIGIYTHWLLVVSKSFSWQRFLMPILSIKNFFQLRDYSKSIEILGRIGKFAWGPIKRVFFFYVKVAKFCFRLIPKYFFGVSGSGCAFFAASVLGGVLLTVVLAPLLGVGIILGGIFTVVSVPFLALAFIGNSILTGLDTLFYLGFNIPIAVGWAFWGLVIGLAIQAYRSIGTYGQERMKTNVAVVPPLSTETYDPKRQKRMKTNVAVAPVLLLCVVGTIRYVDYVRASNSPSPETAVIAAQGTTGLDTETITDAAPEPGSTKQTAPESGGDPILSEAPVSTTVGQDTVSPPSTQPNTPAPIILTQDTATTPTPAPKPATPTVPSEPVPTKQIITEATGKSDAEPAPTIKQQNSSPPPSTPQIQTAPVSPKQETAIIPDPVPKPITPTVPSDMVFIPAGEFQMGSNDNTDEKPVHTVYIDAFHIDRYEVTNAQYKAFIDANPQWRKDQIPSVYHNGNYLKHWNGNDYPSEKGEHPVTYVSWYGAMAYAQWTGKRLPTEAEWEKAARGGKSGLKYPWGNTISNGQANYGNHVGDTTVVGKYPANGYGLYDMAGNVMEWCLDAYYSDFYFSSPHRNPLGGVNTIENANLVISDFANVTTSRVVRGGAWYNTEIQNIRVAYRNRVSPTLTNVALGFRCVKAGTLWNRD